jgi:peptide/nickel transport system substrate-binding protein
MGVSVSRSVALRTGAVAAAVALAATACGSSKSNGSSGSNTTASPGMTGPDKNKINSATVKNGGAITWTIEKTVQDWNPLSSNGNTFDYVQVLNPIYPSTYITNPDFSITLNKDLINGDPKFTTMSGSTPQSVVYQIQPNAKWSDGVPITSDDYNYVWAASNGTNPNVDVASTTGYQDIASVTGSADKKTVTVTWKPGKAFGDWQSLFAPILPAHIAQQHGDVAASFTWLDTNPPTISGGQYVIAPNGVAADKTTVKLQKNPQYYGPAAHLDTVTFRAITDSAQEPTALANSEVDGIYPQPQLDLVNRVKTIPNVEYAVNQGLSYEHIDFSFKNSALGNKTWGGTLRTAMFTAFDRQRLINSTINQFKPGAVPLNSRMLVPGQTGYQDNVTQFGLGAGSVDNATKALTAAGFTGVGTALKAPDGTAIPAFNMRYTVGNQIRQQTCNQFAADMKKLGITVNVNSTDSLGKTLTQTDANHSWDVIVFAWVLTPFASSANQPLFTSPAGNQPGQNYGFYSNADVDKFLSEATSNPDKTAQIAALNSADKQISKDAYTLPLYQKPTMIAIKNTLGNVRDNATASGPTYNIQEWGLKSSTS